MAISNRLKQARKQLNLSQTAFAKKIGVDQGRVSQWETERSQPSSSALAGMVKLGININWLLTGEGEILAERFSSDDSAAFSEKQKIELENTINRIIDARFKNEG